MRGKLPILSQRYTVVCASPYVLFCGEDDCHLFEGRAYIQAIEQLGIISCPTRQLSDPEEKLAPEQFDAVMKEFEDRGLFSLAHDVDPRRAAYWESTHSLPKSGQVALKNLGTDCEDLLSYGLRANGLTVSVSADFLIVATDDYLRPEIAELVGRRKPWLLAKPVGHTIWIGPLIRPGKTACYTCLAAALKANRWLQRAIADAADLGYCPQPSVAALPSTVAVAAGMIATAAAIFDATEAHSALENAVFAFDTRSMSMSVNVVRRRSDCPNCGQPEIGRRLPESLHDFVSPITGIISGMHVTDRSVAGVFHASADFVPPVCPAKKRPALRPLQSLGKGFSAQDAEICCAAEAIERYSAAYQGTEWELRKRLAEVDAVLPNDVLLFSDLQFERRDQWNSSHSEQQWVPEPIEPTAEITFTRARCVATGELKLVPSGLCYMYYPFLNEPRFCSPDTNGCGAGKTLPEALLAATLELVERDAVAIWWYNRISRPAVDLRSFGDASFADIQAAFEREGRDLRLLDVTSDLGIPTYVAIAPAQDGSQPYFGCAAHVSPRNAALKALLEAAQVWFWSERGYAPRELQTWLETTNVRDHAYLQANGTTRAISDTSLRTEEALQFCLDRIINAGSELLYVDLTRPEVGVPVVRAIAPGLRHFWARFRHGRLYDVPLLMSWLERKLTEEELNPVPCMI